MLGTVRVLASTLFRFQTEGILESEGRVIGLRDGKYVGSRNPFVRMISLVTKVIGVKALRRLRW
jgi:hypothetical protein